MNQKYLEGVLKEYGDFWDENPFDRWGFTFLRGDPRLDNDDRNYLLTLATENFAKLIFSSAKF